MLSEWKNWPGGKKDKAKCLQQEERTKSDSSHAWRKEYSGGWEEGSGGGSRKLLKENANIKVLSPNFNRKWEIIFWINWTRKPQTRGRPGVRVGYRKHKWGQDKKSCWK